MNEEDREAFRALARDVARVADALTGLMQGMLPHSGPAKIKTEEERAEDACFEEACARDWQSLRSTCGRCGVAVTRLYVKGWDPYRIICGCASASGVSAEEALRGWLKKMNSRLATPGD